MSKNRTRGILLFIAALASFAVQDGFARHLAGSYATPFVVMLRYWVFAGFVIALAARHKAGFRAAVATPRLGVHVLRGLLLVGEIVLIVWGYPLIGLIQSQAVFAVCPLLVAGLSGPLLGERVTWRRWLAIGVGLVGVIVILRPGTGLFQLASLLPLGSALMYAAYSILTRLATRTEASFPSFFWSAVVGAVAATALGARDVVAVSPQDALFLVLYIACSILSHWLVTRAYECAEASALQPYAYLQIVFYSVVGMSIYSEVLDPMVALGTLVVVGAGLYSLILERKST